MCSPNPPPATDYLGAANAQGAANVQTARVQGRINNPNVITPWGTQTVEWDFNEKGFNKALEDYEQRKSDAIANGQNFTEAAPLRKDFVGNQPTVTQTLTPQQQRIFNINQKSQLGLAQVGRDAVGRIGGVLGQDVDFSGAPAVNQANLSALPPAAQAFDPTSLSGISDSSGTREKVREAMLSRVNSDIARDREALSGTLESQGIPVGSERWNNEMARLDRQQTDSRFQAELHSGEEANRMFGQDLALRGQQMGAQAQQYGQQFGNRSQATAEEQLEQNASMDARRQFITELLTQRQTPLNEISALRSGSQVNLPQFQPYQGSNIAPPPIFGATGMMGQQNTDLYNANVGQYNSNMQGAAALGAAGLGAWGTAAAAGMMF